MTRAADGRLPPVPRWLVPAAAALGGVAALRLEAALAVAAAALIVGAARALRLGPVALWAGALSVALLGYAVAGRGFAYLGAPPLFVGEILLASGVVLALVSGDRRAWRRPLAIVLLLLVAWGAARTVPYLGTYRLTALRDAVVWGYAAMALIVVALVRDRARLQAVLDRYGRWLPLALVAMPLAILATSLAPARIPLAPGSEVPLLDPKQGDVAVHLAGALAFLSLGLGRLRLTGAQRRVAPRDGPRPWLWLLSAAWLIAWPATFGSRGGILTVLIVAAALLLTRPRSGWWRIAYLAVLAGVLAVALNVRWEASNGRIVSARTIGVALVSLTGSVDSGNYDDTRAWRLDWWSDIVDYTVFGPYRWTGKGFGINLATDDGYQVLQDDALRAPHNATMSLLARSGVPGLLLWVAFHVGLLSALLVASRARAREGRIAWSRLSLGLALYLLAFHVNGSFDVFLEGPQGGIWMWTVVGLALATLRLQPRGPSEPGDPREAVLYPPTPSTRA